MLVGVFPFIVQVSYETIISWVKVDWTRFLPLAFQEINHAIAGIIPSSLLETRNLSMKFYKLFNLTTEERQPTCNSQKVFH